MSRVYRRSRGFGDLGRSLGPGRKSFYYSFGDALITAYDYSDRRHVGWMGPAGAITPAKPEARFGALVTLERIFMPERPDEHLLVYADRVYRFASGNLESKLTIEPDERIVAAAISPAEASEGSSELLAAATEGAMRLVSGEGRVLARMEVRRPWVPGEVVKVGVLDGGFFVHRMSRRPQRWNGLRPVRHETIVLYPALGGRGTEHSLSPLAQPERRTRLWWGTPAAAGFPLALASLFWVDSRTEGGLLGGVVSNLGTIALGSLDWLVEDILHTPRLWIPLVLGAVLSASLAAITTRRYGFSRRRRALWTVVTLLLGVTGLLLLWSLCEWPARETCRACKRRSVVSAEVCQHCGAPWQGSGPRQDPTFRECLFEGPA